MAGVTEIPDSKDEFMASSPVVTSISADRFSPAKEDALHAAQDALKAGAGTEQAFSDDVSNISLKQVEGLTQAQANVFANRPEANRGNIETVQELEVMQAKYPPVRNSEQKVSERAANAEDMEFLHPNSQPGDNDGRATNGCVISVDKPILTVQKSNPAAEDKRSGIPRGEKGSIRTGYPASGHSTLPADAAKVTGGELSFRQSHQEPDRGVKETAGASMDKIHVVDGRLLKDVEMVDAGREGRKTPQLQIDPSGDPSRGDKAGLNESTIPALDAPPPPPKEHNLCSDDNWGTEPTTETKKAQGSQQRSPTSDTSTRGTDSAANPSSLPQRSGPQMQNSPPNFKSPEPQPQSESSTPPKPDLPLKSSSPSKSSQESTLEELRAQRATLIASLAALPNIQDAIAKINASSTTYSPSTVETTDTEVIAAANKIVKKHQASP
ncbi:uncharacterized protein BDR25DRAFT_316691 [Lindgomyces ingoldianus]|uniref:Uncharacterized protein n=1 Tax=Lindgomyces ingoldianus TaxID=673940 RepID=A0ACB6QNJ9_9PLEO|nr:uncharacterized protein BDR25DRAFT_316691 [Lindgomyces ingoldianus]KAF2467690.1 hypothetical protein BDR25DRAFT_316691 [Lindgomyces ingoldianus]